LRIHQVFDHATFDELRHPLRARAQAGSTALAVQTGVTALPSKFAETPVRGSDCRRRSFILQGPDRERAAPWHLLVTESTTGRSST